MSGIEFQSRLSRAKYHSLKTSTMGPVLALSPLVCDVKAGGGAKPNPRILSASKQLCPIEIQREPHTLS